MEKLLKIPYTVFNNNWDLLQQFLERKGNPRYELTGDVDLSYREDIIDIGNLVRVYGYLTLQGTSIQSLGNLEYVGGYLDLNSTPIESLGNLEYVGGNLGLQDTPIQSLGNIEYVGGNLNLFRSSIQSLGNLQYVGRTIYLSDYHQIPKEQLTKFKIDSW